MKESEEIDLRLAKGIIERRKNLKVVKIEIGTTLMTDGRMTSMTEHFEDGTIRITELSRKDVNEIHEADLTKYDKFSDIEKSISENPLKLPPI